MSDPNFPPNLDINPLILSSVDKTQTDAQQQKEAIAIYGIAGRVWEATRPLLEYFSPSKSFEPPCTLLSPSAHPLRVVELGSGQSVASLHLASQLSPDDLIVLTDLPSVVPLCAERVKAWSQDHISHARVETVPLAWGEDTANVAQYAPYTHILLCDLVYFPNLYPPLLMTLLRLTEESQRGDVETFGPEVILSYKSRTLALEESFFDALGHYFYMAPVRGGDWDARIFVCKRWRTTDEWVFPDITNVMNGRKGVIKGRSFDLIDDLFGSLEWEVS